MSKEDGNETRLSRTGFVSPIGTLTQELRTKVDLDTELAFRRMCAEAHTDVAGALRDYVCKVVHGKTFEELRFEASQRRRELLLGEGSIGSLNLLQKKDENPTLAGMPHFLKVSK